MDFSEIIKLGQTEERLREHFKSKPCVVDEDAYSYNIMKRNEIIKPVFTYVKIEDSPASEVRSENSALDVDIYKTFIDEDSRRQNLEREYVDPELISTVKDSNIHLRRRSTVNRSCSGNKCAYLNCGDSKRVNRSCILHRFPKDIDLYQKWAINSGNTSLLYVPPEKRKFKFVCDKHFEDFDHVNLDTRRLKKDACPKPYTLIVCKSEPRDSTGNSCEENKLSSCDIDIKDEFEESQIAVKIEVLKNEEQTNENSALHVNEDSTITNKDCYGNTLGIRLAGSNPNSVVTDASMFGLVEESIYFTNKTSLHNDNNSINGNPERYPQDSSFLNLAFLQRSKKFKCDICGKISLEKEKLLKHKLSHSMDKPHHCHICNKQFVEKGNLLRHKLIHANDKPHKCNICDQQFSRKHDLVRHVLIHGNEKSYNCEVCCKPFSRKYNLEKHMFTHSKEKPLECDICQKRFPHKDNLIKHMPLHLSDKSFECEVCKRRFLRKQDMRKHKLTHSNEKPYECDVCCKRFYRRYNLRLHRSTHNKRKSKKIS